MECFLIFEFGGNFFRLKTKNLLDAQLGKLIIQTYFDKNIHQCRVVSSKFEYISDYCDLDDNWIFEIAELVKRNYTRK